MRKLLSLLAIAALVAVVPVASVQAASPHQVDPAGMAPPLNPSYDNWACTDTGTGPICRASLDDAWSNVDTGLACDGRPIYETATYESNPVRWHTPDGLAVRTFDPETFNGRWTLSSTGAGPSITLKTQWNLHYDYLVPGDRSTRVLTSTGSYWQVTARGYGLVWHDVGLVRFVIGSQDEIAVTHGPTESNYGNLDLVLPRVCAILAG